MLLEFSVENYMSIKNRVTFSMVASKLKGHEEENVFSNGNVDLLKSAVIYGANASGKSNLLIAMSFMKHFVITSSKESQANDEIGVEHFRLSTETENKPSQFEIIFMHDKIPYRYGFVIDKKMVYREWLYYVPKTKEAKLFERTESNINLGTQFKEGKGLKVNTRKNALFLSVVSQLNGEIAMKIMEWFSEKFNVISGVQHDTYKEFTVDKLEDKLYKSEIIKFLKNADTGIEDVQSIDVKEEDLPEQMPKRLKELIMSEKVVLTRHSKVNEHGEIVSFEMFEMERYESEGTKKIFALSGPLVETLKNGEILVVDELDAKLHPLITRFILGLFHSRETNPNHAQLIFATHDTSILNNRFFRRDQIWFTEKDSNGSTELYSLAEYNLDDDNKVRIDASFDKDYIQGKYGAIPFVGEFKVNFGEANGE